MAVNAAMLADTFEVNGICYETTSSSTVQVTSRSFKYRGNVVIPDSVYYDGIKYRVTSIGPCAFYECSGLSSVTIPNSVKIIDDKAFWGCKGLTSINIPNSVIRIGDYALDGCSGLTSINIPHSVTEIGICVFAGCSGLKLVIIDDKVVYPYSSNH